MNTETVISREGDTISSIAYEYYGSSAEQVERILARNPGLSQRLAVLPAGVSIVMPPPEEEKTETVKTVNLWD